MPDFVNTYLGGFRGSFGGSPRPFYLVARPGFFGGFGSWLDMFSPVSWNYARVPTSINIDATVQAIDWMLVGADMTIALGKFSREKISA